MRPVSVFAVAGRTPKQFSKAMVPAILGAVTSLGIERITAHGSSDSELSTRQCVPELPAPAGSAEARANDLFRTEIIGGPGRHVAHYSLAAFAPMVYRRPGDASLYYVEGDGRHLVAISEGVVLWREDLFVQANLELYHVDEPKIARLGEASRGLLVGRTGSYIAVQFNSTQFGIVDVATGEFTFLGQD